MFTRHTIKLFLFALAIFALGLFLPVNKRIPVAGASSADWNPHSFWYSPWGRSGTHKGIDIFAKAGTPVLAATDGLIIHTGVNDMGGNNVLILGAKWRFYYYAHLQQIDSHTLQWINAGEKIGQVGSTGNAAGKPPHLHFTIRSLFPLPWQYDASKPQAWIKTYYLDPNEFLTKAIPVTRRLPVLKGLAVVKQGAVTCKIENTVSADEESNSFSYWRFAKS